MPKIGTAESYGRLIPSFLRKCHIDFQSGCTSLYSHQQWRSVPLTLSITIPMIVEAIIDVFDLSHSDWCKMVSQSHFDLHFPDG